MKRINKFEDHINESFNMLEITRSYPSIAASYSKMKESIIEAGLNWGVSERNDLIDGIISALNGMKK